MQKDLTQEWLNWIFENIQRGCDKNELLDTLLKEGFNPSQAKIALGLDLSGNDLAEVKKFKEEKNEYSPNSLVSAKHIPDVPAEIYEIENFLSKDECEYLIQEIKSELRPSTIASTGEYDSTYRTSSTCDLGNKNTPFLQEIDRRICNFIGIESSYGETLQGQHYLENQEFKAHTDYFEGTQLVEHDGGRGQRTYTFMIYLNEVKEGGTTEFPNLNKIFSPSEGKALIWNNLNEDGTLKNGVAEDLVKISICTYWMDKLEERESDKVKEMSERTGGKFYFQPDQRCKTVDSLIEKYPLVASEVLSYSDWCKREGFTMPTIKECA